MPSHNFLFATFDGGGNLPPLLSAVGRLIERVAPGARDERAFEPRGGGAGGCQIRRLRDVHARRAEREPVSRRRFIASSRLSHH